MTLIICLDDNKGMLFNNRRQSRDRALNTRVLELCEGKPLTVSAYSAKLFPNGAVCVNDNFLTEAGGDAVCFAEQRIESLENVDTLYIFHWNRHYPSDITFDFDFAEEGFTLAAAEEFKGSSHEKITLEMYKR